MIKILIFLLSFIYIFTQSDYKNCLLAYGADGISKFQWQVDNENNLLYVSVTLPYGT